MYSSTIGGGNWSNGKKVAVAVAISAIGITSSAFLWMKWKEKQAVEDKRKEDVKKETKAEKAEKPDIIPVQDRSKSTPAQRSFEESQSKTDTETNAPKRSAVEYEIGLEPVAMRSLASTTETINISGEARSESRAPLKQVDHVEEEMEQKAGDSPFISLKLDSLGAEEVGLPMQFSPDVRNEGQGDTAQGLSPPLVSLNLAESAGSSTFEKLSMQPQNDNDTSENFHKIPVSGDNNNSSSFEKISVSDAESNDANNIATQKVAQAFAEATAASHDIKQIKPMQESPISQPESETSNEHAVRAESQTTPADAVSSPSKSVSQTVDKAESESAGKAESESSDIESVPEEDIQEESSSEEEAHYSTTTASVEIAPEVAKADETMESKDDEEGDDEYEDDFESEEEDSQSELKTSGETAENEQGVEQTDGITHDAATTSAEASKQAKMAPPGSEDSATAAADVSGQRPETRESVLFLRHPYTDERVAFGCSVRTTSDHNEARHVVCGMTNTRINANTIAAKLDLGENQEILSVNGLEMRALDHETLKGLFESTSLYEPNNFFKITVAKNVKSEDILSSLDGEKEKTFDIYLNLTAEELLVKEVKAGEDTRKKEKDVILEKFNGRNCRIKKCWIKHSKTGKYLTDENSRLKLKELQDAAPNFIFQRILYQGTDDGEQHPEKRGDGVLVYAFKHEPEPITSYLQASSTESVGFSRLPDIRPEAKVLNGRDHRLFYHEPVSAGPTGEVATFRALAFPGRSYFAYDESTDKFYLKSFHTNDNPGDDEELQFEIAYFDPDASSQIPTQSNQITTV